MAAVAERTNAGRSHTAKPDPRSAAEICEEVAKVYGRMLLRGDVKKNIRAVLTASRDAKALREMLAALKDFVLPGEKVGPAAPPKIAIINHIPRPAIDAAPRVIEATPAKP